MTNQSLDPTEVAASIADELKTKPAPYKRESSVHEFYGFDNRHHVFSLEEGTLKPIQRKLGWLDEPARPPVGPIQGAYPAAFSLPITVAGMKTKHYPLNMGLVIVSGDTKAGKSSFIKALREGGAPVKRLQAVEPYDRPEDIETVPYYSSVDSALVAAVHAHYSGEVGTLFAIDSLRAPLFETGGNAGSKGIVMPFFTQVTRVSQELASAGITILASVNPMEEDPAFTEAFLKKLSASASTTILLTSSEVTDRGAKFTGQVISRPNRTAYPFTYQVTGDYTAGTEESDFLTEITFTPAQSQFADVLGDTNFSNSLKQVI